MAMTVRGDGGDGATGRLRAVELTRMRTARRDAVMGQTYRLFQGG